MPDMDSPQVSGILEQGSSQTSSGATAVVGAHHLSKRPRDEGSPLPGKRGRGENGDISLTLQIPVPASPLTPSGGGNCSPLPSSSALTMALPPLCESPSKTNQAAPQSNSNNPASAPNAFAPFSGGGSTVNKPTNSDALSGVGFLAGRRKNRAPPAVAAAAAAPSLGATDPIFHAALLRVLHRRGGDTCPEALGWRWRGDAPARFDHWPCALHPSVMDLLACVSAGEERVVLTSCDMKNDCCGENNKNEKKQQPMVRSRESAWRAPRPRTPAKRGSSAVAVVAAAGGGGAAAVAPGTPVTAAVSLASTPIARPAAAAAQNSAQTPLSALRRPGSSCRSSNRVRFSTHDMSVVDTPDPARGGSEKGMVSALGGLESILSAAERVRGMAAWGSSGSCGGSRSGRGVGASGPEEGRGRAGGNYEGYFDRFSSVDRSDGAESAAAAGESVGEAESVADADVDEEGEETASDRRKLEGGAGGGRVRGSSGQQEEDELPAETKNVREDAAAFVSVLDEIASGDSAPQELALAGGWGPEHSNAAVFYAKEMALLCGAGDGAEVGTRGAGSHLRVRYLDVLSCLIRYNLKLILNVCVCDMPEGDATMEGEALEAHDQEEQDEQNEQEQDEDEDDETNDSFSDAEEDSSSPSPSAPALTVIVPGRAALLREQGMLDAAWGSTVTSQVERGCGCVTVLDGTGALEFNTEDVAALLTLALARVHSFLPLAARLTAEEASWEDGGGGDGDDKEEGEDDGDTLDARFLTAIRQYTSECRAAAATAAAAASTAVAAGHAGGPSPNDLFSAAPIETSRGGEAHGRSGGPAELLTVSQEAEEGEGAGGGVVAVAGSSNEVEVALAGSSELTVDEAADLLEYVAAARFIAQLIAEPVVSAGVSAGRWACTERLAEHVRKLAQEEEEASTSWGSVGKAQATVAAPAPSLSNMLCLGELADIQGLGVTMAQQARYAPALEAVLKGELRRALRRGQGSRKRRIRNRLQQGAPDVFSFPMITPCCCFASGSAVM